MIDTKNLIAKIRILLKDTSKSKYSDYEVRDAISDALALLAETASQSYSDRFRKTVLISLTKNTTDNMYYASLPDDFIEEIKVLYYNDSTATWTEALPVHTSTPSYGEYSLIPNEVLSKQSSLRFVYYYTPEAVTASTTSLSLPKSYMLPIARMAREILTGNPDTARRYASFAINVEKTGDNK